MPRYVAFLRAINVGGRTVQMTALRDIFTGLGFANVETFIASGNVIFETKAGAIPAIERKIEADLAKTLGFDVPTFVRTIDAVAAAAAHEAFPAQETATAAALNIAFTRPALEPAARAALLTLGTGLDRFHVNGTEVYWLCQVKQSESKFSNTVLERVTGVQSTIRTLTTIQKIAAKYRV